VNARYFMDFYLEVKMHDGRIDKILAEVKPEKQTKPPTKGKNKKISTLLYENTVYAVNIAKWDAAKKYCQKNGYLFYIINEKDLEKLEKI
jgi:hypothetical protein